MRRAQRYRPDHVERHLAAVLAADMVDYSRYMGANEEWTLARLRSLRRDLIDPQIKQHGGRVVKATGDGVLAEFPSAVEAVTCAVEIQHGMGAWNEGVPETLRIALRIGINIGELVVEPDGDIYGDSVNIAARLEAIAPAGGVCLSRAAHDQMRGRLPYPVEDWGERSLKNIDQPVRVLAIRSDAIAQLPDMVEAVKSPQENRPRSHAVLWLAGSSLAIAGLIWVSYLDTHPVSIGPTSEQSSSTAVQAAATVSANPVRPQLQDSLAARLSIVVLPFASRDGGPEYERLAESIAAEITSDLSRIEGSFVIASSTALAYKDKLADVRDLGRELRVRYLLNGSLRHTGTRVRINARLIDTVTGAEIWAERFKSDASAISDIEDDVVAQITRALNIELTEAEVRQFQHERPNNPDAADLAAHGWSVLNRPLSRESLLRARTLFEQALKRDGESVRARVGLARSLALMVNFGWSTSVTSDLARADYLVDTVLASRPDEAMAYCIKGEILRGQKQYEAAVAAHQTAIAYNASLAPAYGSMANAKLQLGQADEAFALAERAVRLSPHDPLLSLWSATLCEAAERRQRHDEAITWCSRSLVAPAPLRAVSYLNLAAAYARKGQNEEARAAAAQLAAIRPGYTISRWRQESQSTHPEFVHQTDLLAQGLREAGLPE
ncbi:tetratricopeptide repeat protein [Methylobacterium nodulans]|uniref:Adenylate/guanylate cyclase n=1 Tax=Methylobacterium nodulans (strain LMG 21967 / CNCM I-2342 / ORS 2060) TaxID=460265 RepID=B8IB76_METNO|nr:adenylate/guanylate cyclase domain-containing protein [Methylobacterium nodulans]ACL57291.1 adenylate/guanylate cyclase [Methylobacterium nodulans ORS 2060]